MGQAFYRNFFFYCIGDSGDRDTDLSKREYSLWH